MAGPDWRLSPAYCCAVETLLLFLRTPGWLLPDLLLFLTLPALLRQEGRRGGESAFLSVQTRAPWNLLSMIFGRWGMIAEILVDFLDEPAWENIFYRYLHRASRQFIFFGIYSVAAWQRTGCLRRASRRFIFLEFILPLLGKVWVLCTAPRANLFFGNLFCRCLARYGLPAPRLAPNNFLKIILSLLGNVWTTGEVC